MKIYISGPITGPNDNAELFAEAEERLTRLGHTVMSNGRLEDWFDWRGHHDIRFRLVDTCNAICFLPGWECCNVANSDRRLAEALRTQITYYADYEEPDAPSGYDISLPKSVRDFLGWSADTPLKVEIDKLGDSVTFTRRKEAAHENLHSGADVCAQSQCPF